jgi:hypothetical protein
LDINLERINLEIVLEQTTLINFTKRKKTRRMEKIMIRLNGTVITEKEQAKFLEIALNKRLQMNQHVKYVSRKASNSHTLIHYA